MKELTKKEVSKLVFAQKQLEELDSLNPFLVFDEEEELISDFKYFSTTILKKKKVLEDLNFLVNQISERSHQNSSHQSNNPEEGELCSDFKDYLEYLQKRNSFHFTTLLKLKFKIQGIIKFVQDYLAELKLDSYQAEPRKLLSSNLLQLQALITTPDSPVKKIIPIEEEFKKIKTILEKQFESKKNQLLMINNPENFKMKVLTKNQNKSVMTNEEETNTQERKEEKADKTDISQVKAEVDDSETASSLVSVNSGSHTSIRYTKKDSFLVVKNLVGFCIKKEGNQIYSKKFPSSLFYFKDVIFLNGVYYLFNTTPGQILKKKNDSSEYSVWWNKKTISNIDWYSYNNLATLGDSSIAVNLNNTDLLVIEVKDDGSAGRELTIKNTSGSRLNFHLGLLNGNIFTLNKTGLITIYQVDLERYAGYHEVGRKQIELKSERKENRFFLALCEKKELAAILTGTCVDPYLGSRILIYKISDRLNGIEMNFQAEIDIWQQNLQYYLTVCFSK